MLLTAEVVFWTSAALAAYTLVVFPALTWLRARLLSRPIVTGEATPSLSVVIACYNEERLVRQRIENLLASDYPADQLEIVIASDGSTDRTEEIVREFARPNVRVVRVPRGGKGQALNAGVAEARGELLVFSDANTEFRHDSLRALVRPFADPRVGGVAGNQRYLRGGERSLSADGECWYWDWDTLQKDQQSRAGSATSATGAIYAIRATCFDPVPLDVMDDFYISTGVIARGLRLVFAADALAFEPVTTRDGIEFRRKVRVATQGLHGVWVRRELANPLRHGWYAIQLLTHKIARRLLVFPLLAMVVSACVLARHGGFYPLVVAGALAIMLLAACGHVLRRTRLGRAKLFTLPHFFCMTQFAMILATMRTFCGHGLRHWEPERHGVPVQGGGAESHAELGDGQEGAANASEKRASFEGCRT